MKTRGNFVIFICALLSACTTPPQPPLGLAKEVDIPRFMGDWYVIANIPTFIEKGATNAIESYRLNDDGTIATTFTFHEGQPTGPLKRYDPKGFVQDQADHAVWRMLFMWPFKSDYRIVYLSPDYQETIIGREARDYVWIMARSPTIPEDHYQRLTERLKQEGYDVKKIEKVPQVWSPTKGP